MKYTVVTLSVDGVLSYSDGRNDNVARYCQERRAEQGSRCADHYRNLPGTSEISKNPLHPCPYGLATSSPVQIGRGYSALTGLWANSMKPTSLPARVREEATVDPVEVAELVHLLQRIEADVRGQELEHFEAALHDARHLNQTISDAAERLLSARGYSSEKIPWDMRAIREDEELRRYMMIYSASRDLSAAMLMHEISRDPTQAGRDISPIPIRNLFYRHFRTSDDRLRAARMTWRLGETDKTMRLSAAFRLLPKILVDNAIKYGARDSEISVNFEERSSDTFYRIAFTSYGPLVRDDERDKVFRRGVRGSNKAGAQGHGLGLWLAKIIVDANSGSIEMRTHEKTRDISGRRIGDTIVEIKLLR